MAFTIEEIRDMYIEGRYNCKIEIPEKVREGHVFDEELSVRRNREMVDEHNAKVVELKKEQAEKQKELYCELAKDIVEYIIENYNLNKAQAIAIERFVCREKHAFMYDYFSYIDTYAEFAEKLVSVGGDT